MAIFNDAVNTDSFTGGFISGTTRDTGQAITGGHNDGSQINQQLTEYQQSIGLNSFETQNLIHQNLSSLGESSIDISNALKDQIQIREDQRLADNESLQLTFDYTLDRFADVDAKLGALGQATVDNSNADAIDDGKKGLFDGFPSLPTFEDVKKPLLIAGLGLLGLMVIPRLIKGGFK